MTMEQVYQAVAIFGSTFLITLWGSFFFWFRFKKRDDARRTKERAELKLLKEELRLQKSAGEHPKDEAR